MDVSMRIADGVNFDDDRLVGVGDAMAGAEVEGEAIDDLDGELDGDFDGVLDGVLDGEIDD